MTKIKLIWINKNQQGNSCVMGLVHCWSAIYSSKCQPYVIEKNAIYVLDQTNSILCSQSKMIPNIISGINKYNQLLLSFNNSNSLSFLSSFCVLWWLSALNNCRNIFYACVRRRTGKGQGRTHLSKCLTAWNVIASVGSHKKSTYLSG